MAKLSLDELKQVVKEYVDANKIAVDTFIETRDNVVGLLDKIGKIFTIDNPFYDKLAVFDGEELSYGKTIEEWYQDLPLPVDYDETGANALAPTNPTYRPASYSYTLGRKVIPITIRNNDIERAVHNEGQFAEIINTQSKRMYDSLALFKYNAKKEILGVLNEKITLATSGTAFTNTGTYAVNTYLKSATGTAGVVVKAYVSGNATNWNDAVAKGYIVELDLVSVMEEPTTTETGEAFIEQLKEDVESASFINEGHSLNGNTIGINEGLVLLVKKGVMPKVEVKVFAGAFQRDDVAIPATIIRVDDFGTADDVFAMLIDPRGIRLHNTYQAVRENFNGKGDFLNLNLHTENTAFISKNTFVKVYKTQA